MIMVAPVLCEVGCSEQSAWFNASDVINNGRVASMKCMADSMAQMSRQQVTICCGSGQAGDGDKSHRSSGHLRLPQLDRQDPDLENGPLNYLNYGADDPITEASYKTSDPLSGNSLNDCEQQINKCMENLNSRKNAILLT